MVISTANVRLLNQPILGIHTRNIFVNVLYTLKAIINYLHIAKFLTNLILKLLLLPYKQWKKMKERCAIFEICLKNVTGIF